MPYLHTVPPEDAAGEVKAIYDQDMAAGRSRRNRDL